MEAVANVKNWTDQSIYSTVDTQFMISTAIIGVELSKAASSILWIPKSVLYAGPQLSLTYINQHFSH